MKRSKTTSWNCKQERIEPTMGSFLFVANNDFISLFHSYPYLRGSKQMKHSRRSELYGIIYKTKQKDR